MPRLKYNEDGAVHALDFCRQCRQCFVVDGDSSAAATAMVIDFGLYPGARRFW